jgi:sulfur carrier protein
VRVQLNGEVQELLDGSTVADLVARLGLGNRRVAVEVNHEIVARDRYLVHALADDDQVEIVHFVGGG